MKSDIERIREMFHLLISGWAERIEYAERITVHGFDACWDDNDGCPQVIEQRAKNYRHPGLIAQLQHATGDTPQGGGDCERGAPNKPASRPPGNMEPLALLDDIKAEATALHEDLRAGCGHSRNIVAHRRHLVHVLMNMLPLLEQLEHHKPAMVRDARHTAAKWIRAARLQLGHEVRQTTLRDTVCGECGGALAVAKDASTDVRCVGGPEAPPCGVVYGRGQWLELARSGQGAGDDGQP